MSVRTAIAAVVILAGVPMSIVARAPSDAHASRLGCGGTVVSTTPGPPRVRAELASRDRMITFGESVLLSPVLSVDPPVPGPLNPEFEARPDGEMGFQAASVRRIASGSVEECGPGDFLATPKVSTTYRVVWRGAMSNEVRILVRPAVSLRRVGRSAAVVSVRAARAYSGRTVTVDVRRARGWRPLKRVTLHGDGRARFRAPGAVVRVRVPAVPGYFRAVTAALSLAS